MSIQRSWISRYSAQESYYVRCDMCGRFSSEVVCTRVDSASVKSALKRLKQLALDMDFTAVNDRHFCSSCYYEWERRGVHQQGVLFDPGPQSSSRYGR